MIFQVSIFVLGIALVCGQDADSIAKVNKAKCKELYPEADDQTLTVTNVGGMEGCQFTCANSQNLWSLFDVRTAPDDQICGDQKSCYKGNCYNTEDIALCRKSTNTSTFSTISANGCQVTCSNGLISIITLNKNENEKCSPMAVSLPNTDYECQSGMCVLIQTRFPSLVPAGGSFPVLQPIQVNPSRATQKPDIPDHDEKPVIPDHDAKPEETKFYNY